MKPQDLKFPFKEEERKPFISDKVFFIPKCYQAEGGECVSLFDRKAPTWIEYCSGNGAWIIEKAKAHPDENWIAVEKRFDRVQKIWAKMKNAKLDNLFIVCGEALDFTSHYVPDDSFAGIYINFPDPWPKRRHAKFRLLQANFFTQMARVSAKDTKVVIVTDHEEYARCICKELLVHPSWRYVFPEPYFVTQWHDYGTSYFEELWRFQGKTIHYLQFSNGKS